MTRAFCVHPRFERIWPYAATHFKSIWTDDDTEYHRLNADDERSLCEVLDNPAAVTQLVSLGLPANDDCLETLDSLEEAVVLTEGGYAPEERVVEALESRGVSVYRHDSEGYWGQSVAEDALALTLCGLRRVPQLHCRIQHDQSPWDHEPNNDPGPGRRGHQFADDARFANGTVAGKRVGVVGLGNIGSRYADFVGTLGADVVAHDPYVDEPVFHRTGARRACSLADIVTDADVFAPLVPPSPETTGIVDTDLVAALPEGCLVVLATRARVVDTDALRRRVLNDELALAADVWDENPGEPLPLDDPVLGSENVVHTPHIAGRTRHANEEWAERLAEKFESGA